MRYSWGKGASAQKSAGWTQPAHTSLSSPRDSYQHLVHHRCRRWRSAASASAEAGSRLTTSRSSSSSSCQLFILPSPQRGQQSSVFISRLPHQKRDKNCLFTIPAQSCNLMIPLLSSNKAARHRISKLRTRIRTRKCFVLKLRTPVSWN